MADREKVICAIKNCIAVPKCRDCPWEECEEQHVAVDGIPLGLIREALALLEEQEPVKNGKKVDCGDVFLGFYECGYCKNAIRTPWRYCPFCGKEVKWNDET